MREVGTQLRKRGTGAKAWHSLAPLTDRQRCHERRLESPRLSQLLRWEFVRLFQSLLGDETETLSRDWGGRARGRYPGPVATVGLIEEASDVHSADAP